VLGFSHMILQTFVQQALVLQKRRNSHRPLYFFIALVELGGKGG